MITNANNLEKKDFKINIDNVFESYKEYLYNYFSKEDIFDYKRILMTSVLNRSLSLMEAYKNLIPTNNLMVLNSLTRLQLDNCIFIYAVSLLFESGISIDEIGKEIISNNKKLSEYKIGKQKLHDTYLILELDKKYGMKIKDMYEFYCRFVHFSDSALLSSTQALEDNILAIELTKDYSRFEKYIDENAKSFIELSKFVLLLLKQEWGKIPNGKDLKK